ncbi:MAG: hypothetical protein WAS33_03750 [Candidatus Promineifilaceae bacterium]
MQNRNRIVMLVLGIVALCVGGTAVFLLIFRIFFGGILQEPAAVEILVEAPPQVVVNEPFVVTVQLTNIITTSQTLHSLDFEEAFLEHISLRSATPAYQTSQAIPLTNFTSYPFNLPLPANSTNRPTVVELTFVGRDVGEFSGVMDICFAEGTLCKAVVLETAVIER